MLERIGQRFEKLVRQYMPDPFLLALIFSLLTVVLAAVWTHSDFFKIVDTWFYGATKDDGFWALLKFSMQMVLIVVTGEAVAASPIVHRAIKSLAGTPRSAWGAVAFVSMLSMFLGWLHWGFGLISAALLSREVAAQAKARGIKIHYPLLGAAGYTALLIWHGGLSASAPLNANSTTHFAFNLIGRVVPMEETVFSPMNFFACGVLLFSVPFLLAAMTPKANEEEISTETLAEMKPIEFIPDRSTIAGRIDASPVTSLLIVLMGATFLWTNFQKNGWTNLNHDIVNFSFLMIGLALHRSPMAYAKAISQSLRGTSGIVLQFPFYGGIMGIMNGTGLGEKIAHVFIGLASAQTLPFFTYLCSVSSKLFVPSGGGEWAIEGPVMLRAALDLKASVGKTILAICYGNMVGNMFQPFWALPLLGIMGLSARQIMGYCLVVFCFAFPVLGIVLLIFS